MAELVPYVLQAASVSHPAEAFRRPLSGLIVADGVEGVGTELAVTAQGTPNMTVNVAAGGCFIKGDTRAAQGTYHAYNDATKVLTIAPAHASLGRRDLVVAHIEDNTEDGSGQNRFMLMVITGTPAASPVVPATPATGIPLARITVNANATSITTANILDLRVRFRLANPGPSPKARATRAETFSVPNAVETLVDFTAAPTNNPGGAAMWVSSSPSRITILEKGLYTIVAGGHFEPISGGTRHVSIRVNGAYYQAHEDVGGATNWSTTVVADLVALNANDYVQLMLYHTQGAPILGRGDLSVRYIGAA